MKKTEPVFPPLPVTRVLAATVGHVTVTTKLYGPVSAERLSHEQREIVYRAEQLTPAPPRVRRDVVREPLDVDEYEFQSGGRR